MNQQKYNKGDFFIVPNRKALEGLDPHTQTVYMWLCARADADGSCFPSLTNLAKTCGMTVPTVNDRIHKLESEGLITKESGNSVKSNKYHLVLKEVKGGTKGGLVGVLKEVKSNNNHRTINNNNMEEQGSSGLIVEIIKLFSEINPACKKMYDNKTQRGACQDLLDSYSFEDIKKVIALIPKTNGYKYCPTITTPLQLRDKWVQLETELKRIKSKKIEVI